MWQVNHRKLVTQQNNDAWTEVLPNSKNDPNGWRTSRMYSTDYHSGIIYATSLLLSLEPEVEWSAAPPPPPGVSGGPQDKGEWPVSMASRSSCRTRQWRASLCQDWEVIGQAKPGPVSLGICLPEDNSLCSPYIDWIRSSVSHDEGETEGRSSLTRRRISYIFGVNGIKHRVYQI